MLRKLIFGKRIFFNTNDRMTKNIIKDRFRLYPNFDGEEEILININEHTSTQFKEISKNPKLHSSIENGFEVVIGNTKANWKYGEKIIIDVSVRDSKNSIISMLKKFISREFNASSKRIIDQILYEQILVPTMYNYQDYALIHSSGFKYKGKTFLLGGTGGTGKTSASIQISQDEKASFINDDMSVVDSLGYIYPNLAYPKIYAYNTIGDVNLERELLLNKSLGNKLHWKVMKKINISKVRRKIAPEQLFKSVETVKIPLDYYIILFKEDVQEMKITEINKVTAIDSTIAVMQSEYSGIFNNHVFWHEFNSLLNNKEKLISMNQVLGNWKKVLNSAFNNKKLLKLSIPLDISHTEYKKQLGSILEDLTKDN